MKRTELVAGQDYAVRRHGSHWQYLLLSTDPFVDAAQHERQGDTETAPTFTFDVPEGIKIPAWLRTPKDYDKPATRGVLAVSRDLYGNPHAEAEVVTLAEISATWDDHLAETQRASTALSASMNAAKDSREVYARAVERVAAELERRGEPRSAVQAATSQRKATTVTFDLATLNRLLGLDEPTDEPPTN